MPANLCYETQSADNTAWWERISKKEWEPYTIQIMQQLVTPDSIVVDLGAWVGVTPIVSALLGAYVFAFEPDPTAFGEMMVNIGLNSHLDAKVSVHPWYAS
jgi:ribosomal protein L11 methylase PrmA